MGNKAHRMGDKNTADAAITSIPQSKVFCNGELLSVDGSTVADHSPHTDVKTANGSLTVKIGGTPVNSYSDADTCGHTRTGGSSDVNIGG
jgi:uncharacterized Zn-binding protein involved in type VI secretion